MAELSSKEKIKWLMTYARLRREARNMYERLAEMRNEAYIPAQKERVGSSGSSGASDRMANATIRYLDYEARVAETLAGTLADMEAIESAVNRLTDPLQREVMRLRYIDGKDIRDDLHGAAENIPTMLARVGNLKWREVAVKMYGNDDEAELQAVYRLHGRALQNIRKDDHE